MNNETALFLKYRDTGDRIVFDELFRMTKPWVYKLIYRIIPDKAIADDVFQDTWIHVINYKDKYNSKKGIFNNFLYTAAKNNALKAKFKDSKFVRDNPNDERDELKYGVNELSPEKVTEIMERNEMIRSSIKTLAADYQDVILLHYFADLDVKEIAENLNKPEGTIKTWLSRSREQLRKKMQKSNVGYYMNIFIVGIVLICFIYIGGSN